MLFYLSRSTKIFAKNLLFHNAHLLILHCASFGDFVRLRSSDVYMRYLRACTWDSFNIIRFTNSHDCGLFQILQHSVLVTRHFTMNTAKIIRNYIKQTIRRIRHRPLMYRYFFIIFVSRVNRKTMQFADIFVQKCKSRFSLPFSYILE